MERFLAVVKSGVVENLLVVAATDTATIEHFGGVLVPVGERVEIGWTYDGVVFAAPVKVVTLEELKAAKLSEIKAARDTHCFANVTALGHSWQADKRNQDLLGSAITLAQSGLPLPLVWRTADNVNVPISSISDLLAIAGEIAARTQAAYATSWALKAQVAAAASIEQVQAVVWP